MTLIAICLMLGEGVALLALYRFVRSFGAYVEAEQEFKRAILATHESNLLIHSHNLAILDELRAERQTKKEVA